MERDYQDARSEGRWRRGCVRFRSSCEQLAVSRGVQYKDAPMPLGSLGSTRVALLLAELVAALGVCWSTMVDVDEERLKVLASGARCVSLSSAECVRMHNGRSAGLRTLGELPRHGCSGSTVVRYERWQRPGVRGGNGRPRRAGRQAGRRPTGVAEAGGRDGSGREGAGERGCRGYRGSAESGDGLSRCPRRPVVCCVHF